MASHGYDIAVGMSPEACESNPLAKKGVLYYYHSKTKLYGDWFFWTWYHVLVPTYQNVLSMLNATTLDELDFLLDCIIKM